MKVFLSGKVDDHFGAWRDALLGRDSKSSDQRRWVLHLPTTGSGTDDTDVLPWPVRWFDGHAYVGPYRQVADRDDWQSKGVFHGVEAAGQHGMINDASRTMIVERCLAAVRSADVVFAYLNSDDAHGTLCEIGYAAAFGKYIAVACPQGEDFSEWFPQELASLVIRTTDKESEETFVRRAFREACEGRRNRDDTLRRQRWSQGR